MKRKKSDKDIDGDAMASARAVQRIMVDIGEQMMRAEYLFGRYSEEYTELDWVRIKFPTEDGHEYLAIVKAFTEEGDQVAFHAAPTFHEVVIGLLKRLENRSIKWREDKYADSNTGSKTT